MPFMSDSRFNASRLIKIGLWLLLGGTAVAVFVMGGGLSGSKSLSVFYFAVGIPLLTVFVGFVLMCAGTMGWALRLPIKKLTWSGLAFLSCAAVCILIIDRIPFGFDDPSILLVSIPLALLIVGVLLLLSAGVRHVRAANRRTAD